VEVYGDGGIIQAAAELEFLVFDSE
jgi:hypothetical protein